MKGKRGAEILVETLKKEGVTTIFGYPGGSVIELYDVLYDEPSINHVLVRHEQGAAHAADGYARASGKIGVCLATSGPGAMNLVTGLVTAAIDSSPVIALTGQVSTDMLGKDAFQEADTFNITMPFVKHNFLVKDVNQLDSTIKGAIQIASTRRKGVVLVDLPSNVLKERAVSSSTQVVRFEGYNPNVKANKFQIKRIAKALLEAERPLILVGGGVIASDASKELVALAELLGAGVVYTLMGKGSIPDTHPLCLGMTGMHGKISANKAITECDLLLAIGTRFSDRVTGWKLDRFAPNAYKIHVDIDSVEINKNLEVDLPMVGDARDVLKGLLIEVKKAIKDRKPKQWKNRIKEMHQVCNGCHEGESEEKIILPEKIIAELNRLLPRDAIVTTEVGQCQMFAAHFLKTYNPRTFLSSGGLGTMGFGFPAAIGAKVAKPDKPVVDIAGDGSFTMVSQELGTSVSNDIPVIVCIFNNGYLGMVRQWQELFYGKRYSHTRIGGPPNFVKLAEAYGARGIEVEKPNQVRDALKNGLESKQTTIIDFHIGGETNILPMIPPGGGIDEMIGVERCRTI